MTRAELIEQIKTKKSFLCVGLDTDINKIPKHLLDTDDPVFEFNKAIIDATLPYAVSYKLNLAFYESMGVKGWESLEKTVKYLPKEVFKIADAKRGDIGNTAEMYAKAFFENMTFDAVTVSPYMGRDAILPFLKHYNKWVITLALTSNKGAEDFEFITENGQTLYQTVIQKSLQWGNDENTMFVVGATRPEYFKEVRRFAPTAFLLVPGVGAQGGNIADVCQYGLTDDIGLLINSSRGIIYASGENDFADKAKEAAQELQREMAGFVK
jgi:orotidine-5'-phosphate decarboxylase